MPAARCNQQGTEQRHFPVSEARPFVLLEFAGEPGWIDMLLAFAPVLELPGAGELADPMWLPLVP